MDESLLATKSLDFAISIIFQINDLKYKCNTTVMVFPKLLVYNSIRRFEI